MIKIENEKDAQLLEAIGHLAAKSCDLSTVDIVADFKKQLIAAVNEFGSANATQVPASENGSDQTD